MTCCDFIGLAIDPPDGHEMIRAVRLYEGLGTGHDRMHAGFKCFKSFQIQPLNKANHLSQIANMV